MQLWSNIDWGGGSREKHTRIFSDNLRLDRDASGGGGGGGGVVEPTHFGFQLEPLLYHCNPTQIPQFRKEKEFNLSNLYFSIYLNYSGNLMVTPVHLVGTD